MTTHPEVSAPAAPGADARRGRTLEAAVLAVAFVLVNLATAATQKPFPFSDTAGWEGVTYLSVARQIAAGNGRVHGDAPMVYRLGTPALAALTHRVAGWDFLACFRLVNGTANGLILVLLVVWLRRHLADWRVRAALGLTFLLQWDAPVRWMYFFPAHTDPWMWVFLFAGLLAVDRCRTPATPAQVALVTGLVAVGVCFREIVLVVALVLPFADNPVQAEPARVRWRDLPLRFVPLLAGVAALAAVRLVARRDDLYSFAVTAVHYLYAKSWLAYLQSWFMAFGPLLWLALLRPRWAAAFLAGNQHLAVYLLAFATLAVVGGSDTERFLYWTMPVVYVLIGLALEEARHRWPVWLFAVLAALQLVAVRAVFWPAVPEYPNNGPHRLPLLTPFGRDVPFGDLYTETGPHFLMLLITFQYLALGLGLAAWRWRRESLKPSAAMPPEQSFSL